MKTVILDNNQKYVIIREAEGYTLFSNLANQRDICLRKTIFKDGKYYYDYLDDENEVNQAISKLYPRD